MSYERTYDQPQDEYGSYNPYGQQSNPYGQQNSYQSAGGNPYQSTTTPYSDRPALNQQSSSRYDEESNVGAYEMTPMNSSDPNRILNECRAIDQAVRDLEQKQESLRSLHSAQLNDVNPNNKSPIAQEVAAVTTDILNSYRNLVKRAQRLKADKESGNPRNQAQVGRVDRMIKTSMNKFQQLDRDHTNATKEAIKRQVRIAQPDASESEVNEAAEDPSLQVFSQTLMNTDRRGQSQKTLSNVRSRHEAIQKIEQDMIVIAGLFNDLDAMVVQQEAPVAHIEEQSEVVTQQAAKANTELDGAVKKARAARKKKWICAGIVLLIIIIIVVVVVVVVEVTKK